VTERRIRHRALAYRDQTMSVERRLRELRYRRFAVRTAKANVVTPAVFDEPVSVLELVVSPGRWQVTGVATFAATAAAEVDFQLSVAAADPVTDEDYDGDDFDAPVARHQATHSAAVTITLFCYGDLIQSGDDNIRVMLRAMNGSGGIYSLTDVRLTLWPV
jgi:hypothetical protein